MTEYEKMMAGLAHLAMSPELKNMRKEAREILFEFNRTSPNDEVGRNALIQRLFGQADETTSITGPFYCDYGINIKVGKNFYANFNCTMLDSGGVIIGDEVLFAPNVSLYTVGHPLDVELRNEGWEQAKPITIGNNVWIGGNVVILPGVTIGDNVVVGAGSVVNKDLPSNVLAFGNPCRIVREITAQDREHYLQTYQPER
ncbi:sugar O-acetyltransferase [Rodentibacter trehalosifermentans]|uniref:Acetyltransferase n=1 Tax=Rodentibacter trehalosifermentans TaxID=1908263 RepID=A0A1V3IXK1_9PAST|nr:sugar O-acetyltransferase [Rodentibacter trehalosifermentans]OOF46862.1 galactoside O-acetyltransferase [Rodentibacter trehalosifermentans]OOF47028.1 galactoside O-acetyltransferase [Rodentibacter trehalosifermentans]OOF52428.1 galactoside O-acetyltransferase [Rodentibacter trehalosifermentans]